MLALAALSVHCMSVSVLCTRSILFYFVLMTALLSQLYYSTLISQRWGRKKGSGIRTHLPQITDLESEQEFKSYNFYLQRYFLNSLSYPLLTLVFYSGGFENEVSSQPYFAKKIQ